MFGSTVEAIRYYSEKTPDTLCVADDKKKATYKEFMELIEQYALVLQKRGVVKGERVVIEAMQTIDFMAIWHATNLLSAVAVPLEARCAEDKLRAIGEKSGAKLIVSVKEITDDKRATVTYKQIEEEKTEERLTGYTLPKSTDVSDILFSTGTTGKEKGIVLTHGATVASGENVAHGVEMREGNVEMIPSPLNHSHGIRSYYSNIINGMTVIIVSNVMDLKKYFRNFDEYGVNSLDLVPAAASVILKLSGDKLGEYRDRLRYIEFGSAPMMESDRNKLKELLPGVPLYNFYGSTECGRSCYYNFNTPECKKSCIGKPTYNTTMIIVDENRNPIKSDKDHTGLIAGKGPMNMIGYWEDDEETAKAMDANGYVYSNDEAYFDEDGDIILLGRKNDVINIGGKKVAPEEIENEVKRMSQIADCGVIAIEAEGLGSEPVLYVQMKPGETFNDVAIKNYLNTTLEPFKVPKKIEVIDKIPRTFNGKLLRKDLLAIYKKK